jgi:diguanylate cyclase (GGDEF)-like protein/PAS domain S-box-containing protein
MAELDIVKQVINALPLNTALVSPQCCILHANEQWIDSQKVHIESGLFSGINTHWPNAAMLDERLNNNLTRGILRLFSGDSDSIIESSELSLRGYTHRIECIIKPLEINQQRYALVSIKIEMDLHSIDEQPALLAENDAMVINSLREGVVIQDADGVITSNNPSSEIILGLSAAQMRGLDNADPRWGTIDTNGADCPPEKHPSSIAIATGKPVLDFTMGVNKANGITSWLRINSQPVFHKNSKTPYMTVTSFFDLSDEIRQKKSLEDLSQRLQLALDAGNIGIWEYDVKHQTLLWDDAMFKLFSVEQLGFSGKLDDFTSLLHPEDKEDILEMFTQSIKTGQEFTSEFRIILANKEVRFINVAAKPIFNPQGEVEAILGINRDISIEKMMTEEIELNRQKLSNFIRNMPVGAISIEGEDITLNDRAEEITGYDNSRLGTVDSLLTQLFDADQNEHHELYQAIVSNKILDRSSLLKVRRENGQYRWIEFTGCALPDGQAWVLKDITEQVVAEDELKQLAYHDALTQLPNRLAVESRIEESISRAKRHNAKVGLLLIDLDLFKNVNDTYGHPVGDQLLVTIGQLLQNRIRGSDILGRIGGDEFLVVVEDIGDQENLLLIGQDLINSIPKVIELGDNINVSIGLCIGASLYPEHAEDSVKLFRNADTALYEAKSQGRNKVQIYHESYTQALETRLTIEQRIDIAIQNSAFVHVYQPIVDCKTGEIIGAEALMRWHDSDLGHVGPDTFIPVAEESGQIIKMGRWALKTVCCQFVEWRKLGIDLKSISVNLSPVQFIETSLIDDIEDAIQLSGIEAKCLVLEITEGILMENRSTTKLALLRLKSLGVRLAIDDFGTGYSSLAYLKDFDVDILKIDRSFIKDIPNEPRDEQITAAILSMAKNLNLKVTAEGIEEIEQLNFVNQHECDYYQGYIKSPGLSGHDFVDFFREASKTII